MPKVLALRKSFSTSQLLAAQLLASELTVYESFDVASGVTSFMSVKDGRMGTPGISIRECLCSPRLQKLS